MDRSDAMKVDGADMSVSMKKKRSQDVDETEQGMYSVSYLKIPIDYRYSEAED